MRHDHLTIKTTTTSLTDDIKDDDDDELMQNDESIHTVVVHERKSKVHSKLENDKKEFVKEVITPLGKVKVLFGTKSKPTKNEVTYSDVPKYSPVKTTDGKIAILYKGAGNLTVDKYHKIIDETTVASTTTTTTQKYVTDNVHHHNHHQSKKFNQLLEKLIYNNITVSGSIVMHTERPKYAELFIKTNELQKREKLPINFAIVPVFDLNEHVNAKFDDQNSANPFETLRKLRESSTIHKFLLAMISLASCIVCIFISFCYLRKRIINSIKLFF